LITGQDYLYLS